MRIMVTGGAGFIGHNVVSKLESMGHKCGIIDIYSNYGILDEREISRLVSDRKLLFRSDVYDVDISANDDSVERFIAQFNPEVIIHLASFPRQKFVGYEPKLASRTMMDGTVSLLDSAKKHGVRRFVFISSSMVYGNFLHAVSETDPCDPVGQYGIMKLAGELLVKDCAQTSGIEYSIVRPSAVYGPRDISDRVISKFFLAAMAGGTIEVNGENEILDFTHVSDTADGIVLAALLPAAKNKTYNITRGKGRTLLEAANLIVDIVGRGSIKLNPKDNSYPSRNGLCIDSARSDLGYNPKIDIESGFKSLHEWLKKYDTFY